MNPSEILSPLGRAWPGARLRYWPRNWWINAACWIITLVTTTMFGSGLVSSFQRGTTLDLDLVWHAYNRFLHADPAVWNGLQFSIPLLLILLAHEFGHYVECRRWNVDASLPYFLPSPTLFGTFGAFIRIQSAILYRASLFDIGIAGPLAGFAVLVPVLIMGMSLSQPMPVIQASQFTFGLPLGMRLLEWMFFPHVSSARILLHPMAIAAFAGLLATAINLLPVGQLDGGHIVYAAFGPKLHRNLSTGFVGVLAVLGYFNWTWLIWGAVLFFFGRRHPLVYDREPLSRGRWILVAVISLIFLLSFTVVPVQIT